MTFKTWAKDYLTQRGLWPSEADFVLAACREEKAMSSMLEVWHREIGGYPPSMRAALALNLKRHALKWIDVNAPLHFARALLFDEGPSALHADEQSKE